MYDFVASKVYAAKMMMLKSPGGTLVVKLKAETQLRFSAD